MDKTSQAQGCRGEKGTKKKEQVRSSGYQAVFNHKGEKTSTNNKKATRRDETGRQSKDGAAHPTTNSLGLTGMTGDKGTHTSLDKETREKSEKRLDLKRRVGGLDSCGEAGVWGEPERRP